MSSTFKQEYRSSWKAHINTKEIIINGLYILYNRRKIEDLIIADIKLKIEPVETILKALIPLMFKKYNDRIWNQDPHIIKTIHGFINALKQPDKVYDTALKTAAVFGVDILKQRLYPEVFPLFVKKIIISQDLETKVKINNKDFEFLGKRFSNDFLMELIDSPLYTLDDILDHINLFDIDYASTFLKFKNIQPYISQIQWTPEKMRKQKLVFDDIITHVQYFSHECLEVYSLTNCTAKEKETLFLLKEMI